MLREFSLGLSAPSIQQRASSLVLSACHSNIFLITPSHYEENGFEFFSGPQKISWVCWDVCIFPSLSLWNLCSYETNIEFWFFGNILLLISQLNGCINLLHKHTLTHKHAKTCTSNFKAIITILRWILRSSHAQNSAKISQLKMILCFRSKIYPS